MRGSRARGRPTALAFLATVGHRLLLAGAFLALFAPAFGPSLDRHFAERHPYHSHVFLDRAGPDHLHFYDLERPHTHQATEAGPDSAPGPDGQLPGVIYLTSTDGLGHGAASAITTSVHTDVVYRGADDNGLRTASDPADAHLQVALVPPPEKPPRV